MDFYEILCVRRDAKPAEIRRAYQRLARLLHPDVNPGDPAAAERFAAVSRAFQILADVERRARYDRGESPPPAARRIPEVGFEGFDFSAETRAGSADFKEIFDGVLKPAPAEASEGRGEDLVQATRVSFEEAFHGTRRRVHLVRQERCETCEGRGQVVLSARPCSKCQGTGQVRTSRGRIIFTRRCTDCDATGTLGRRPCSRCGGEGRLIQSEWLEVQIPPGVGQGSQVRLPGCGNAGRQGGPPGDFILDIESEPHAFYKREGEDLTCEIPITIIEAALGAHVEVPTPDGPVTIEIPAGTQAGQRFRLRKRGMPKLGEKGRGDLWVEVRVWVPPVDDDESQELLREFARRNPHDPRRDLAQNPAGEGKR